MNGETNAAGEGHGGRLDSWKEIAAYLNRDQRTVRRWEQEKGLPVHRLGERPRASVYAFRAELERWMAEQEKASESQTEASPSEPTILPPAVPNRGRRWLTGAAVAIAVVAGWAFWWRRAPSRSSAAAATSGAIRSLVVLPLANLSGAAGQDYFAAALSDELTTDLAQLPGLQVISRTSAMAVQAAHANMATIHAQLGVDGVIEGSVVRAKDRVRINVQLIRAATDQHIWAQSFESNEDNILRLQDDMAHAIAGQIGATLRQGSGATLPAATATAVAPAAYDEYLHAVYWLGLRDHVSMDRSVAAFERATRLEPKFAPAWSGLAEAECLLADYQYFGTGDVRPTAEHAVQQALQLDPNSAEAHAVEAFIAWRFDWDWPRADGAFRQALALNPNSSLTHEWYALYLSSQRKRAAAEEEMQTAVRLDPLSRILQTNLGMVPYYAGDLAQAGQRFQAALQLDVNFTPAATKLWLTDASKGEGEAALADLLHINRMLNTPAAQQAKLQQAFEAAGLPGLARTELGVYRVQCGPGYCSPYAEALLQALGGASDAALASLSSAYEQRDPWLPYLAVEPAFRNLRSDARFIRLQREVGLAAQP